MKRPSAFTSAVFGAGLTLFAGAAWAADPAFDGHSPTDVLAVLTGNGASGQVKTDDKGLPYIDAKAGKLGFEVDFFDCNEAKALCNTVVYTVGWNMSSVSLDQLNGWNRWTALCPAYLNKEGHPHAWYGLKPSPHDTREDVAAQQDAWMQCLSDFDRFTDAPDDFLKAHQQG